MTDARPRLLPSPEHPITIEPAGAHVVVRSGSTVIAESDAALALHEGSYPTVLYVPLVDVDAARLVESAHQTYCPYKGDASYYDIVKDDGTRLEAAVWHYREPYPAVEQIDGHVAFYSDRVEVQATPG